MCCANSARAFAVHGTCLRVWSFSRGRSQTQRQVSGGTARAWSRSVRRARPGELAGWSFDDLFSVRRTRSVDEHAHRGCAGGPARPIEPHTARLRIVNRRRGRCQGHMPPPRPMPPPEPWTRRVVAYHGVASNAVHRRRVIGRWRIRRWKGVPHHVHDHPAAALATHRLPRPSRSRQRERLPPRPGRAPPGVLRAVRGRGVARPPGARVPAARLTRAPGAHPERS